MSILIINMTSAFAAEGPYVGILAGVNSTPNSKTHVSRVTPIGLFTGYNIPMSEKAYLAGELSIDYFLGLSLLPGWMLTDTTMIYGRVGSASAQVKNKTTGDKRFLTGIRVGLGLQRSLTKQLSIRGEYDYSSFPKFAGSTSQINSFNVGLVYNFH